MVRVLCSRVRLFDASMLGRPPRLLERPTLGNFAFEMSDEKVVRRPPTSPEAIEAFEHRHGVRLPPDTRAFYLEQNGLEIDGIIFQILPIEEVVEKTSEHYGRFFAFAEHMIWLHCWVMPLRPNASRSTPVYDFDGHTPFLWSPSFRAFVDEILADGFFALWVRRRNEDRSEPIRCLLHPNPHVVPHEGKYVRFTADADDGDLLALREFADVNYVDLWGTRITDAGLEEVVRLPNLQYLHLDRTAISDGGLRRVARCRMLRSLSLQETNVTDAGLKSLLDLEDLNSLNLAGTAVTEQALELFSRLPRVRAGGADTSMYITLRDTRIGRDAKRAFLARFPNVLFVGEVYLHPRHRSREE
jgi:SMI1/KNR4 family protein SUKH-1/Leucine Rich Repeat (LRR) protein